MKVFEVMMETAFEDPFLVTAPTMRKAVELVRAEISGELVEHGEPFIARVHEASPNGGVWRLRSKRTRTGRFRKTGPIMFDKPSRA